MTDPPTGPDWDAAVEAVMAERALHCLTIYGRPHKPLSASLSREDSVALLTAALPHLRAMWEEGRVARPTAISPVVWMAGFRADKTMRVEPVFLPPLKEGETAALYTDGGGKPGSLIAHLSTRAAEPPAPVERGPDNEGGADADSPQ